MLKRLWLFSLLTVAWLTVEPAAQSQASGRLVENKPAGQETANSGFGTQTRDSLDVRDAGVDCGFSSDSSVALNAITARASSNGLAIVFPPGCHVKLAKTTSRDKSNNL